VTPATAVFDASVFVRAAVDRLPDATSALARRDSWIVPDLMYPEALNAATTYWRVGRLSRPRAEEIVAEWRLLDLDVRSTRMLAAAAFAVAVDRGLTAYDACYVALAEAEQVPLVTADRRLAAATANAELVA